MTWLNVVCLILAILICITAFIPKIRNLLNKSAAAVKFESIINLSANKYVTLIVVGFSIAAAAVRLWQFGAIPAGFNQDGAMGAVDAYALVKHGTDRFGMRFPVHFTAWGFGQMSVLLSYLSTPFMAVFGLNRITARIAVVIVSLLAIWVLYRLCSSIFGRKAGIAVLAFCALDPWQIMQSRWALDCNMFPHFLLFSIYFLYLGVRKRKIYLYISMLLFALTMYSYGIAWYTVPLFLAAACIWLLKTRMLKVTEAVLSGLVYLTFAWPILGVMIVNYFKLATISTPLFTIPYFPDTVRTNDIVFFSRDFMNQLINNLKVTINVVLLQKPDFVWNSIPEYGTIYLFSMPFAVVGMIYLVRSIINKENKWRMEYLIVIWLVLGILSGLIINNVNINRINLIFYPIIILCGIGIYSVARNIRLFGALIAIIYISAFVMFSSSYFGPHSKLVGEAFYDGFGEAVQYAVNTDSDRLYITNWTQSENSWWVSEPLTLFHAGIDALYFQGRAEAFSKSGKKLLPYSERYKYVHFSEFGMDPSENAAYVINNREASLFDMDLFNFKQFSGFIAVTPKAPGIPVKSDNTAGEGNLLVNPGFEDTGNAPVQGWSVNPWDKTPGISEVNVDSSSFKSGGRSIHIVNSKSNDTRLEQIINVEPDSLYLFSCWIKAKNIGIDAKGANLSFSGLFSSTRDIRGTSVGWEYVQVYGRTGKEQHSLALTVGIGGYGSINSGEAWFDDVLAEKVTSLPTGAEPVDLFIAGSTNSGTQAVTTEKSYGSEMVYYTILYLLVILLACVLIIKGYVKLPVSNRKITIYLVIISGFILRLILAQKVEGFPGDIACFKAWAYAAAENLPGMYRTGMFLDYPPFYMYVLFIVGKLAAIPALGANMTLLVKLPSILADLATAYLVYHLAEKRLKPGLGYAAAAIFLFNPAIILNSTLWGMVDSFFMLLVITAILLVVYDKVEFSVIFFAASVLMKPQGVFFLPVLVFALIKGKSLKKLLLTFVYGLITTVVIVLPFFSLNDPLWIFKLYLNTASGYPFASMNAYNLFSLFGGNLKDDSSIFIIFSCGTWSLIFDVLLVLFAGFIFFRCKNAAAPVLAALLLNAGAFVLSSRMHERYMYPVIVLSLILFLFIKDKTIPVIFSIMTLIVTMNMQDVLYRVLNTGSPHIPADDPALFWFSLVNVLTFIGLAVFSIKLSGSEKKAGRFSQ